MNDVEPRLYTTVIREMIRHENDVTNHRIMWLLIGQGLIANAYVGAGDAREDIVTMVASVGILVTLSAFVILYKSYQAPGYLAFLRRAATHGRLSEEDVPLFGWPAKRIQGWRKQVWACDWVGEPSELLEPFFFLPTLLVLAWLFLLLQRWLQLNPGLLLLLSIFLVLLTFSLVC